MNEKLPIAKENTPLRETMEVINKHGFGIAFIVNEDNKLIGVVTDGDIRRAILRGVSLNESINEIMTREPIKIYDYWSEKEIEEYINSPDVSKRIPGMGVLIAPVITGENKVVGMKAIYGRRQGIYVAQPRKHAVRKVLILGGAGYIGSVLSRMMLESGYRVKVMDNLLYGDEGIRELYGNKNFEFIKGDITSIKDIVKAMEDVDAVVHLAAIVGDPASKLKPRSTIETNYLATKLIGESAKFLGVKKFIFASTCSVYGFHEEIRDEESETNPLSLYAETKLMSEKALIDIRGDGFCPVILRFATAYGLSPRMRFDLVVNLLTAKAVKEGKITIFGYGKQYRPFVHIRDISRAIIRVLEASPEKVEGEIFNVGSDEQNLSIKELAEKIKSLIPDAELIFIPEKEDDRSYKVSFKKINEILGFDAKYTIEDAVKEIKEAFESALIEDYTDRKYSNYKSLKED